MVTSLHPLQKEGAVTGHKPGYPPPPFQLRLFLAPVPHLEAVLGGGWGWGPCHRKAGTRLWGAACLPARGAHLELEVIVAGGAFHGERLGEAKGEANEGQGADSWDSGSPGLRLVGPREPPGPGSALGPAQGTCPLSTWKLTSPQRTRTPPRLCWHSHSLWGGGSRG